jgi:hypothetical protein
MGLVKNTLVIYGLKRKSEESVKGTSKNLKKPLLPLGEGCN